MSNNEKTLLNHYNTNMSVHATIVLAIIFGLFSVLGITSNSNVKPIQKFILAMIYWILGVLGHYEVSRYKHYGNMAKQMAKRIAKQKVEQKPVDVEGEQTLAFKKLNWALQEPWVHLFFFLFLFFSFIAVYIIDIANILS